MEYEIDVIRIQMQEIEEQIQDLEKQEDVDDQLRSLKYTLRKTRVTRMLKEK